MRVAGVQAFAAMTCVVVFSGLAFAQEGAEVAARRDLLTQAQQARDSGDHARALDLATRAGAIEMTPSVRMFIAQEQAAVGQLAPALGNAEMCEREADHDPTLRNRETIMSTCRQIATSLQPRIGHVVVAVPANAPSDLRVTVAGDVLNHALYGVPYVITPGSVVIEATGTGIARVHQVVSVNAGGNVNVPLTFTAAPVETASAQPATSSPSPAATTTASSASPAPEHAATNATASTATSNEGPSVVPPVIVMGAGVLGLGAGVVLFFLRQSAISNFENNYCNGPDNLYCDNTPASQAALSNASTLNGAMDVAFIAGGVLLVAGVAWLAVTKLTGHPSEHAALRVAPIAGVGFVGVGGTF